MANIGKVLTKYFRRQKQPFADVFEDGSIPSKFQKQFFLHISDMLKTLALFILLINAYIYFRRMFLLGRWILFTLATTFVTLLKLLFGVVLDQFFQVNHYNFGPVRL